MGWPEDLKKVEEMKFTDGLAFLSDLAGVTESVKNAERYAQVAKGHEFLKFMKITDDANPGKVPLVGTTLNVVGAVATGITQFQESTAQSTVFKTTDAVTAGLMDWAVGAANPVAAVADGLLGMVTKSLGYEVSLGQNLNGASHALNTFVDGVISWDEQGMQSFHEKSLNGEYGLILQGASHLGQYLSENYELHPAVVNTFKPFDFDEIRARYEASQPKVPSLRLGE